MKDSAVPNDFNAVAKVRDKTAKLRLTRSPMETSHPLSRKWPKEKKRFPAIWSILQFRSQCLVFAMLSKQNWRLYLYLNIYCVSF